MKFKLFRVLAFTIHTKMSKAKHNIIPYTKLDFSTVNLSELADNDRVVSQKLAYFRQKHPKKGENQFASFIFVNFEGLVTLNVLSTWDHAKTCFS